ncbi:MAG: formylglycine-generating enzyme family protein [Chlorobia bacterium]|nr:formylglycine-generating enzyme family protein [Fimbriimonadaceae bacterium]
MISKANIRRPVCVALISMGFIFSVGQSDKLAPYVETVPNSVLKIQMVPVPGGTIAIGKKSVKVKPFYMATTETTWELFDAFLNAGPPSKPYDQTDFAPDAIARPSKSYILPDLSWGHSGYPTINVSSTSVEMFCRWLSKVTNKKYRLPTEAEWEMACTENTGLPMKLTKDQAENVAWYAGNSKETTHPVGKKAPNKLGLHDMFGNVGEWATDLDGKPVLCGPSFADTLANTTSSLRKRWSPKWQETDPQMPKSRWWLSDGPFCGFRVVCEP